MVKEIQLTQGKVALIDDEDYNLLNNYSWHYNEHGYAKSRIKDSEGVWKLWYMHRFIMNAKKGQYVDHINHDKLDNRKGNLRLCSNQQNSINSKVGKNNTSGFKGVFWEKCTKKWQARILHNKKSVHIGFFVDKIEAAIAYDKKLEELFGEYALTNKAQGLY